MKPSDELLISFGPYHATLSSYGASLRRLWRETTTGPHPILWGYSGTENKRGGQGDVLIPFPGRIPGGHYFFDGTRYELERNDKEGPNAIHGFVRNREWSARASEAAVSFRIKLLDSEMSAKGYPFSLDCGISYQLSASGLACHFSIQNIGTRGAPVGAGFHPYFTFATQSIHQAILQLPAKKVLDFGPGFLPTGKILPVENTNLDFTSEKRIQDTVFNHCFCDLTRDKEGFAHATLKDSLSEAVHRIWMSESLKYLVVYTGEALGDDARKSIAIEPMTCGTDAFNRPEWGLQILKPGEFFTGSWGVQTDPGERCE